MEKIRCNWCLGDQQMMDYHDTEWGVPVYDDKKHFEFIVLDTFQAGLSWKTILHRRAGFKKAFANFDVKKVAKFTDTDFERLMLDEGIIRNKLKIRGTIGNAQAFMAIQKEFGSFDAYIWQFTKGKTLNSKRKTMQDLPALTTEAEAMSKDLYNRGFKFVGSTICYAYMQAAGLVNDHLMGCFRYKQV